MKPIFIIFFCWIFIQCSSSSKYVKERNSYYRELGLQFREGYKAFTKHRFHAAATFFRKYLARDSTGINYEAVAFLAYCYSQLGEEQKGREIYSKYINAYLQLPSLNSKRIQDLQHWKSIYPDFPDELKAGNGFTLVMLEPPKIVGGYKRVVENFEYPRFMKNPNQQGTVVMQALIDTSGQAVKFHIYKSAGALFDSAAVDAVRKTAFSPGKKFGRKYPYWYNIPVSFNKQKSEI
jgi:TonB family protein